MCESVHQNPPPHVVGYHKQSRFYYGFNALLTKCGEHFAIFGKQELH